VKEIIKDILTIILGLASLAITLLIAGGIGYLCIRVGQNYHKAIGVIISTGMYILVGIFIIGFSTIYYQDAKEKSDSKTELILRLIAPLLVVVYLLLSIPISIEDLNLYKIWE
jgi:chromate transport protein ChrA